MIKRKEPKIKDCIGIREIYNIYKERSENPVDYVKFAKYTKECNKQLIDVIINQSEKVVLPYLMGNLHIAKFERNFSRPQKKWAIDFVQTKKHGFAVYHDQEFIYKWRWEKTHKKVANLNKFKFTASRASKRRVAEALRNKIDYFKI